MGNPLTIQLFAWLAVSAVSTHAVATVLLHWLVPSVNPDLLMGIAGGSRLIECVGRKLGTLGRMKRRSYVLTALGVSSPLWAQPAALEASGVFGECNPVNAAVGDELRLHREPNAESEQLVIPYRQGWRVVAPKREGLTRVLTIGVLRVIEPDERMTCSVEPQEGPSSLASGETVEYLYYLGEGFGQIRFRGAQCSAEVVEELGHFAVIRLPEVQVWLRVFYADGTSPGWLLHDGTQTRVVDVEC